jgi:hypothetical protein
MSTTRTVAPKAAAKAIEKAISTRRPTMLWGPPGIGKSDVVRQIADKTNREMIDIRLALWDPTDIKGMPYFDSVDKTMKWAPPSELPQDPNSNAIIFLDELPSAPPAVQAAAYQLILNRKVGAYRLPDGVDIVAAGNRETDRGVTFKMPAPLANRFLHLEMRVDFDDWMDWAVTNKVHKDVVGYLSFAKQDLFDFDAKSASRSFATPRSWSFVSELLEDEADMGEGTLVDLVSGGIGDGLAVKFMAHRKVAAKMPKPMDVLNGKVDELKIDEISALYSLTVSLCYELKELASRKDKKWYTYVDQYFNFMMKHFPTELVVMGSKVLISTYKLDIDPEKMKSFDEFFNRFGQYVFNATAAN